MEIYGVGRPAIREAILTLQKEGFVSVSGEGELELLNRLQNILLSLCRQQHVTG